MGSYRRLLSLITYKQYEYINRERRHLLTSFLINSFPFEVGSTAGKHPSHYSQWPVSGSSYSQVLHKWGSKFQNVEPDYYILPNEGKLYYTFCKYFIANTAKNLRLNNRVIIIKPKLILGTLSVSQDS